MSGDVRLIEGGVASEREKAVCISALVKIMSWNEPSPMEAYEAYTYYRGKYNDAAYQRGVSIRQENGYIAQKNSAMSDLDGLSSRKLNFEKRLEGIKRIIAMMEGTGGVSVSVPEVISNALSTIQKADSSYKQSIRLTGGVAAASLEAAFAAKTVERDTRLSSALQIYKTEKAKLEENIANLQSQMTALSDKIDELNRQIRECGDLQASLKGIMNSSVYSMNHYRPFM